jgi:hypothetical protein
MAAKPVQLISLCLLYVTRAPVIVVKSFLNINQNTDAYIYVKVSNFTFVTQ